MTFSSAPDCVLQETQQVGQFVGQLVRIAVLHIAFDRHDAERPAGRCQRDDQARLIRGAAQRIVAQVEGLGLDAPGIAQVDVLLGPPSLGG